MEPFAQMINAAKKYVVSSALERVDWNAELVRGDLGKAVQQLKQESGKGLFVSGVTLPLALAELGLIDEYEFVVHPRLAGHGPTLLGGAVEVCRLEAREPAGVRLGGGGDAVRAEKVTIWLVSRPHRGARLAALEYVFPSTPRHR
ncbi:dihydrofolate reductase family protein [Microtetraspora glauca]|uniref:Dihydrofolate reductase family protein n=1 Tax=Microtetraspora glauca TaxID=1996 RepID=A0ABV3GKH7_MICGL